MSEQSCPLRDTDRSGAIETSPATTPDDSPRVISSDSLLGGKSQLAILHNQSVYFLRQTRFGKLILTK